MSYKPSDKWYFRVWFLFLIGAIVIWSWSWIASVSIVLMSTISIVFFKLTIESLLRKQEESFELEKYKTNQNQHVLQEQLDILMMYYPHPMILFNQKGSVVLANASFRELVKLNVEGLMYDNRSYPRPIYKLFKQAYYQEMPMIQDIQLDHQFYSAHCLPIYVSDRYHGFLCVLQDVTRLIQQDKLQRRFVADASHELKTPITAIKGISELILRTPNMESNDKTDFLSQLYDQSLRLESIVKDMLTLSKLSEDKMMIVKQPNNAKALIEDIIHSYQVPFQQHQLQVKVNVNDKTVLFVDKKAFESILTNLISNVMIHASATLLEINVEETLEYVYIRFSDNGLGIDPAHLPHIFDRFYRTSSSRGRVSGGSGLGLNIARSFILAHQGNIEVESKPNEGTIFKLTFPKLTLS
ncbi:MAG: HAMP domain-containing histidine kinase [Erysipelothrix sp.]|nr:HAMP domain-containing histidine kinase [Erysipelothrix sp.]